MEKIILAEPAVGIDIGSTTAKLVIIKNGDIHFSIFQRMSP